MEGNHRRPGFAIGPQESAPCPVSLFVISQFASSQNGQNRRVRSARSGLGSGGPGSSGARTSRGRGSGSVGNDRGRIASAGGVSLATGAGVVSLAVDPGFSAGAAARSGPRGADAGVPFGAAGLAGAS